MGRKTDGSDSLWVVVLYDGTEPEGVLNRSAHDFIEQPSVGEAVQMIGSSD